VLAADALVHGDALALVEDLDGAATEPHLDLGAHEAMRDAVVTLLHLDVVVVDADAAEAPFGRTSGLAGKDLSACRSISQQACSALCRAAGSAIAR
jgi:hypothetical protein